MAKQGKVTAVQVAEFIHGCMSECEADGYQQQEEDPIHEHKIETYRNLSTIAVRVGDYEFLVRVTRRGRKELDNDRA